MLLMFTSSVLKSTLQHVFSRAVLVFKEMSRFNLKHDASIAVSSDNCSPYAAWLICKLSNASYIVLTCHKCLSGHRGLCETCAGNNPAFNLDTHQVPCMHLCSVCMENAIPACLLNVTSTIGLRQFALSDRSG